MARRHWTHEQLVAGVRAGDHRALARVDLARRESRSWRAGCRPGALSGDRARVRRRHHRAARGREVVAHRRAHPTCPRRSGCRSGSSRSIRRARSRRGRCSVTGSGSSTTSSTPASSSARWAHAGISEASPRRRCSRSCCWTRPGRDVVFIETVGTGQSEVEVMSIADEVVLVLMPGSGDSVQALKAGIMEIPDVIAINKMDQPGAKAMLTDIRGVVALDPEPERTTGHRAHRGGAGGGHRGALEGARRAARSPCRGGELEARRRRNLAGEVVVCRDRPCAERHRGSDRRRIRSSPSSSPQCSDARSTR